MSFYRSLCRVLAHLAGQAVEVELRMCVDEAYFLSTFSRLYASKAVRRSVAYAGTRSITVDAGDAKVRSEYCADGSCHLATVRKARVMKPIDIATDRGRLRIDAQTEDPVAVPLTAGHIRHKERVSFRLDTAPAWRLDFTRVTGDEQTFEVEAELDLEVLSRCTTTEECERAAMQGVLIVLALEITSLQ